LLAVAQRLRDAVDPADSIARWSGDEFVILAEGRPSLDEAIDLADAVLNALERPVAVRGRELFASVSIGVAVHHAHDDKTADALLREADVAVHRAKARGKHRSVVYDLSMDARAAERLELTLDLRRALDRSEFVPYYQPMVALATGEVALREALIRWRHPRRGVIPPGAFIPLAEDSHMIVPVGRWMLSQACRDAQAWSAGCLDAPMVSVNLSARQVAQPDLATVVAEVLGETGLDPSRLVLEITETTLMEDIAATREMLIRLKDLGLCLAIDDFGTGYSSLAYLKELPVDFVKIDRSFIAGLARESHDAAIVAAIITVAHSLGLRVVAEGIEEPEQLALLRSLDCDLAQGFLLARPAPLKASELVA
ncbi:MAG TPA: bifunctional diguanylate cyclase/phosphodiesterase, partial [Thermomicrobiaceae bacterium]|nr:bifunctional diguanylate cyclase/phosphodiesterase [Thermomicrobiaceae bacterium]